MVCVYRQLGWCGKGSVDGSRQRATEAGRWGYLTWAQTVSSKCQHWVHQFPRVEDDLHTKNSQLISVFIWFRYTHTLWLSVPMLFTVWMLLLRASWLIFSWLGLGAAISAKSWPNTGKYRKCLCFLLNFIILLALCCNYHRSLSVVVLYSWPTFSVQLSLCRHVQVSLMDLHSVGSSVCVVA